MSHPVGYEIEIKNKRHPNICQVYFGGGHVNVVEHFLAYAPIAITVKNSCKIKINVQKNKNKR